MKIWIVEKEIDVRVSQDEASALIEVRDSGPGIATEHFDKAFQHLYQVDMARARAEGGSGLGLSIVEWAVSVHDGSVERTAKPGQSCTSVIRLPLIQLRSDSAGHQISETRSI